MLKFVAAIEQGRVVQLDRISDFGSEGWGFESSRGHRETKGNFSREELLFLFPGMLNKSCSGRMRSLSRPKRREVLPRLVLTSPW